MEEIKVPSKRIRFTRTVDMEQPGRMSLVRATVILAVALDYDPAGTAMAIDLTNPKEPKIDLVPMPDWFDVLSHGLELCGEEPGAGPTETQIDDLDAIEAALKPVVSPAIQRVLDGKVDFSAKDRLLGSSGLSVKQ